MKTNLCLGVAFLTLAVSGQKLTAQSTFLDSSFNPGTGATDGLVETVIPQPDGKVLICGNFLTVNGVQRSFVARLNNDGSVDTSFEAHPGYWVRHMALQPDGKIVIGGFFTNVEGVPRNRIARLNPDGSLDKSFDPGLGAQTKIVPADDKDPFVFWVLVQPDGKIVITGNFLTYNGTPSSGLARVNPDGSLDTTFHVGSGYDSWGRFLLLLPNNQIIATGWFTSYNGQSCNRMVRVNPDGSADPTFKPFFGDKTAIYGAVALSDGKLIVVGHSINDQGLFLQKIARLNTDGSFDSNYTASASDKVESIYLQPDGKTIIGGYFSIVDGVSRNGLARLNSDGSLDESFKAETDNFVWTVHPQLDGKVLVCGGFTTIDGISRNGVARLLATSGPAIGGTGTTGTGSTGTTGTGSTGTGTTGTGTTGTGTTGGGSSGTGSTGTGTGTGTTGTGTTGTGTTGTGTTGTGTTGTGTTGTGTTGTGTTGTGSTGTGSGTTNGGSTGTGGSTGSGSNTGTGSGDGTASGSSSGLTPPTLLQPVWAQGQFTVQVPTVSGHTYELQYQTPGASRWLALPRINGDGTTHPFVDPNASGDTSRIYRVLIY